MTSDGCGGEGDRAIRARVTAVEVRAVFTVVAPRAVVTLDPLARNPILFDAGVLSDVAVVVLTIQRAPQDGITAMDVVERAIGRGLADTVGATDDLGGALSLDDDQVIAYGKAFDRIARVADALRADASKPVADSAGVDELAALGVARQLSDAARATDTASRAVAYVRAFPPVYAIDYFAQAYVETDEARVADTMQRAVGRSLERIARATDVASRAMGRPIVDTSAAVDAAALSVARALVHAAAAADQIAARAVAKARADAAAADDAGALISQGYVDNNSYFLADYVGASRTFT